METPTKTCQSCKQEFAIAAEDFDFYKKMDVPPPTWCPECRWHRRMAWRNERALHRRKSDATGKDIVSIFRPDSLMKVYEHEAFYSDNWDPLSYGADYNFSRPFFAQFRDLMLRVPTIALFDSKSTNTSYCNVVVEHKNCYLSSAAWNNEDCMYMNRTAFNKNCMDLYISGRNQFSYENLYCEDSYRLFYSHTCGSCNDSYFLYDCRGCSDCFGCTGLRNKKYHIFNQPYAKEEYLEKLKEFDLGDWNVVQDVKRRVAELRLKTIHRYADIYQSTNAVGDHIHNARNAYHCFDFLSGAENVKYASWSNGEFKDSYDTGPGTGGNSELLYDGVSVGVQNSRCMFDCVVWYSNDVRYSLNCQSSNNLFGCASMRSKSHCILNKQYSKEEYEALVPKIIEHMNAMPYVDKKDRTYKYGEFFPPEFSPFPYNDTVGLDYMPLTEGEAAALGYNWAPPAARSYRPTVKPENLPAKIGDVPGSITNEVIGCAHGGTCHDECTIAFRITPDELQFYRKMNIPLPRLCFNCRHWDRLRQRNPMRLWERTCQCGGVASERDVYRNSSTHPHHGAEHCPNTFQTTFAPERQEIVYCEECYNAEIV